MDIDEHTSQEYRKPRQPIVVFDDEEADNISHSLQHSLHEANDHHDDLRASYIQDAINDFNHD